MKNYQDYSKSQITNICNEAACSTGDLRHVLQEDNYLNQNPDKVARIEAAVAKLG